MRAIRLQLQLGVALFNDLLFETADKNRNLYLCTKFLPVQRLPVSISKFSMTNRLSVISINGLKSSRFEWNVLVTHIGT